MATSVKHLSLDGRRLAYREAGSGPAIIFLHGLGGNSASWERQFVALSTSHRVVAWDMPGFGNSEPLATSSPATRTFSALAERFMEAAGIEQAVGIGTSFGAVILADLVQSHPSRFGGVVFTCGVTGMGQLAPEVRARLRENRRAVLAAIGQRKFAETHNSTYLGKGAPEAIVARVVELAGSAMTEGYLQAYNAMTEADIFPSLALIKTPALVVSGADDPIAPAHDCERVAKALSNAEYHCIENAGHYVNLEQAETLNRLINRFLARIALSADTAASVH